VTLFLVSAPLSNETRSLAVNFSNAVDVGVGVVGDGGPPNLVPPAIGYGIFAVLGVITASSLLGLLYNSSSLNTITGGTDPLLELDLTESLEATGTEGVGVVGFASGFCPVDPS
jgi:hypothetical protein